MLNVLIVDDEPFIRQGLTVLIDWEAEGFCIAGEASNGEEAISLLKKGDFDLVIADIRMPVMGGIELLRQARESGLSSAPFVILSGHYEFEYAKEAIRFSCTDYILKPIKKEELLSLLRKVSADCQKSREAEKQEEFRDRVVLERHLTSLILGKFDSINLDYARAHIGSSDCYRYVNVQLDMSDKRVQIADERTRRSMQRRLYDHLRRIMGANSRHIVFDVNKHEDCFDVGFVFADDLANEQSMSEREYLEWFADKASSLEYGITVQAGCQVPSLEKLSDSFRSATIAKLMHSFSDGGLSLSGEPESTEKQYADIGYGEQKRSMDDLVSSIEQGDRQAIERNVGELYRLISESNMDYKSIELNMNYIMFKLLHLAAARDPNINQEEIVSYLIENTFDKGLSRGSKRHFLNFCLQYTEYLEQLNTPASSNVITKVEQEIRESYMQNISLKSFSEKYFINSAYLGQLFKKHYGTPFKDYLNTQRINAAAEMLLSTRKHVYEISESVGYQSLDYFISKFVAAKGHTPTQYRKRYERRSAGND
ncbi:MAG: response regulator [Oscillospiraceae bacterium]|nr:response regulator [Oscillospiraceae bacterium]